MFDSLVSFAQYAWMSLADAILALIIPTAFFVALAIVMKRREALGAAARAAHEMQINLGFYFLDTLFVVPVLGVMTVAIAAFMLANGLVIVPPVVWETLGVYPTLFFAVFLGDFIGYWRHRLEHTRWLWPTHAIHHSDEEMTWLTLNRFHPINRIRRRSSTRRSSWRWDCRPGRQSPTASCATTTAISFTPICPGPTDRWARCLCRRRCTNGITPRTSNTPARTSRVGVLDLRSRVRDVALPGPCDVPLRDRGGHRQQCERAAAHPFKAWFGACNAGQGRGPKTAP